MARITYADIQAREAAEIARRRDIAHSEAIVENGRWDKLSHDDRQTVQEVLRYAQWFPDDIEPRHVLALWLDYSRALLAQCLIVDKYTISGFLGYLMVRAAPSNGGDNGNG